MAGFLFTTFAFLLLISIISGLLHEGIPTSPTQQRRVRRGDIPTIPPRPEGVGADAFHGSQFQFFDEHGFVAGSPGVEAAPVFLYSRTQSAFVWCPSSS